VGEQRVLVTTNHVIGETYTLLRSRLGFDAAQGFMARTRASALTRRVFVPESWEAAAEDLLGRYSDQDFSYVDAISFVAMRRLALSEAFTFDHRFTVAGFTLLAG
jgi:predicted nucleic acid-binding protein